MIVCLQSMMIVPKIQPSVLVTRQLCINVITAMQRLTIWGLWPLESQDHKPRKTRRHRIQLTSEDRERLHERWIVGLEDC